MEASDLITPSSLEAPLVLEARQQPYSDTYIVLCKKGGVQPYVVWMWRKDSGFFGGDYYSHVDDAYRGYKKRGVHGKAEDD